MSIDYSRLRSLTARRLISALVADGFSLQRQKGSHRHYRHSDGRRVTVSFHHSGDTFRMGTLRSMVEIQARWTAADLERLGLLSRTPRKKQGLADDQLREEFNRWAEDGRGEGMEEDHLPIVLPTLELMNIQPADNVLDVGCGAGWLAARIAALVPEGRVVGMDVSDEMVRLARRRYVDVPHVMFIEGGVDEIPWEDAFFQKVITVESAYYWPDPARGVREIFRVLADEGTAWLLINYYRDNPHCHQWGQHYQMPSHLLWAEEWMQFFRDAGFADVAQRRIPDPSPSPETYTGRWFRDAAQLRAFKAEGALLVHARKPPFAGGLGRPLRGLSQA